MRSLLFTLYTHTMGLCLLHSQQGWFWQERGSSDQTGPQNMANCHAQLECIGWFKKNCSAMQSLLFTFYMSNGCIPCLRINDWTCFSLSRGDSGKRKGFQTQLGLKIWLIAINAMQCLLFTFYISNRSMIYLRSKEWTCFSLFKGDSGQRPRKGSQIKLGINIICSIAINAM